MSNIIATKRFWVDEDDDGVPRCAEVGDRGRISSRDGDTLAVDFANGGSCFLNPTDDGDCYSEERRRCSILWPVAFAVVSWALVALAMFWGQLW